LAKALEDVESALRLRAGFGPALVTRARIRVQLATGDRAGSLLDTIKDLDNALEEAPKLVEAHLERAKVMELMGNAVEAIDSLGRALEIVRFDVAILRDRARLLIANGKTRQALSDYSVLIRAGKATTDDWRRSGDCHAELELWRDAIADYSEVLDRDPKDLVTLLRRAQCYASQGDLTAAESDCYRVLQAMPDDAAAQALQRRLDSMRAN
jgi:tetratricopeptide (TPR) repeat protein